MSGKTLFQFTGSPNQLIRIGNALGLPGAHKCALDVHDTFTLQFEGDVRDLRSALAGTGFFVNPDVIRAIGSTCTPEVSFTGRGDVIAERTVQFGDSPEQLAYGTSDGKPAPEEENFTGQHAPEDIAAALAKVAGDEKEAKRQAAADRRARKAEEKRQADAQARMASVAIEAEQVLAADPNGASLDALLSQDPETPLPETVPPVEPEPEAAAPADDDLSALLGDDEPTEDPRAQFADKSDTELRTMLRDKSQKNGVIWLKTLLGNLKKQNLAQISREETIEALLANA